MTSAPHVWIFGYGSLLGFEPFRTVDGARPTPAVLRGYRRGWSVAMDNSRRIPGYKAFVDPQSGEQPAVFVTFLNIESAAGAWLNGVLFPVPESELDRLDARERNYDRREVTPLVDADVGAPVWAYVGSDGGRRRYEAGRAQGTAVISAQYLAGVEADFASFGPAMLETFRSTTDPPDVPVLPLDRVDLPPG